MEAPDIKAALLQARTPQQRIADSLRVGKALVSHVIHGRKRSRRVAKAISRAIGKPVSEIWPGRYDQRSNRGRK